MRRSSWMRWGLAASALVLSTSGCRRPVGKESPQASRATPTAEEGPVQGVVSAKMPDQLKVNDATGREHTVRADEHTQVFIGEKPAGLGEIREGAEVRASFPAGDEQKPAARIDVIETPSPAP